MKYLEIAFLLLNVLVSVLYLLSSIKSYNALGQREISSPITWVWFWQLAGAGLVSWTHSSAWNLLWWFVLGLVICYVIGKLMVRAGRYL